MVKKVFTLNDPTVKVGDEAFDILLNVNAKLKQNMPLDIRVTTAEGNLIEKETLKRLKSAGIHLKKEVGIYSQDGKLPFDSRSDDLRVLVSILLDSIICDGPVHVLIKSGGYTDAGIWRASDRRAIAELLQGIPRLNLEWEIDKALEIPLFRNAREALPKLIGFAQRPPVDSCPYGCSLPRGSYLCDFHIIFADVMIQVRMYKE